MNEFSSYSELLCCFWVKAPIGGAPSILVLGQGRVTPPL